MKLLRKSVAKKSGCYSRWLLKRMATKNCLGKEMVAKRTVAKKSCSYGRWLLSKSGAKESFS